MTGLEKLCVLALIEDLPGKGLQRGPVGTIVEDLAAGIYEVEFSDAQGRTYATAALHSHQLMPPRSTPLP
jgi:Domain of unknown function (DUF4926)